MSYFSEQAVSLIRTDFGDRADLLRDEIYRIMKNHKEKVLGPVTINMNDGNPPISLPPGAVQGPNGSFTLPDLIFPDIIVPQLQPQLEEIPVPRNDDPNDDGPIYLQRKRTQTIHERAVVPAVVLSGDGPSYTVSLRPNGSNGEGFVHTATELNGATGIEAGKWILVFRHLQVELEVEEFIEKDRVTGEEKVVRTEINITEVNTDHEFVRGGGGGGGGVPAQITGGGPGQSYSADVYPDGLSGESESVIITQLEIDAAESIPAGTWVIAVQAGEEWYCQVAVWL